LALFRKFPSHHENRVELKVLELMVVVLLPGSNNDALSITTALP